MKNHKVIFIASLLLLSLMTACASVKTLGVWKDEAHTKPLKKVLVIAVAKQDFIRNQFENVLSNQLRARGLEAIPSYKVLPQPGEDLDRDTVLGKVRELGVDSVIVTRSIGEESITNLQSGIYVFSASAMYTDGWYTVYTGTIMETQREYDTDFYTVATNFYDVDSKQPFWSNISRVKVVEGARQGAINRFIPEIVKQLQESKLLD